MSRWGRLVVAGGVVVGLALAGVVAPTVTLPAAEARAVPPDVESVTVRGVDQAAKARPGAMREAVGADHAEHPEHSGAEEEPRRSESSTDEAGTLAALSPQTSTQDFLVAGVTWDAAEDPEVTEVALRVREDGGWTEWQSLGVDGGTGKGADPGEGIAGARGGTEPFMTGGADGVQLRVRTAQGRPPSGLQVDVVDPGTAPADENVGADSAPPASADAGTGFEIRPSVVSRAQWGADPSLASRWPDISARLDAVYVHHTVGSNSYSKSQSAAIVRGIYAYHTKSRGWPDIGYQFLVDKFGRVFQGRKDARVDNPIGAQAGGYNTGTIGVSAMGNFETAKPTSALMRGLANVVAWKMYQYEIGPKTHVTLRTGASSSATRASAGTKVRVPRLLMHRTTHYTACPGQHLVSRMPALRTMVKDRRDAALARHGDVRYTTKRPARVLPTSSQRPVQWKKAATYRWKSTAGAAKYQVLERTAHWKESMPSNRYWREVRRGKGLSIDTTLRLGQTRKLAVRAIDAKGRRGPVRVIVTSTRPVSPSQWSKSGGWTKVTGKPYYGDRSWRTSNRGATIAFPGADDVERVRIRAATAPGDGRVRVKVGGTSYGTINLDKPKDGDRTFTVTMPGKRTGKVELVSLDGGDRVRISSVSLIRW